MTIEPTKPEPLKTGDKVLVTKGCKSRDVVKGSTAVVKDIYAWEVGGFVAVHLYFLNSALAGQSRVMYVRHRNRLSDHEIRLSNRPEQVVRIRRKT